MKGGTYPNFKNISRPRRQPKCQEKIHESLAQANSQGSPPAPGASFLFTSSSTLVRAALGLHPMDTLSIEPALVKPIISKGPRRIRCKRRSRWIAPSICLLTLLLAVVLIFGVAVPLTTSTDAAFCSLTLCEDSIDVKSCTEALEKRAATVSLLASQLSILAFNPTIVSVRMPRIDAAIFVSDDPSSADIVAAASTAEESIARGALLGCDESAASQGASMASGEWSPLSVTCEVMLANKTSYHIERYLRGDEILLTLALSFRVELAALSFVGFDYSATFNFPLQNTGSESSFGESSDAIAAWQLPSSGCNRFDGPSALISLNELNYSVLGVDPSRAAGTVLLRALDCANPFPSNLGASLSERARQVVHAASSVGVNTTGLAQGAVESVGAVLDAARRLVSGVLNESIATSGDYSSAIFNPAGLTASVYAAAASALEDTWPFSEAIFTWGVAEGDGTLPPPSPSPPPPAQPGGSSALPCTANATCTHGCGVTPSSYEAAGILAAGAFECYRCESLYLPLTASGTSWCAFTYNGYVVDYCCAKQACEGTCEHVEHTPPPPVPSPPPPVPSPPPPRAERRLDQELTQRVRRRLSEGGGTVDEVVADCSSAALLSQPAIVTLRASVFNPTAFTAHCRWAAATLRNAAGVPVAVGVLLAPVILPPRVSSQLELELDLRFVLAMLVSELTQASTAAGVAISAMQQGAAVALITFILDLLGDLHADIELQLTTMNVTLTVNVTETVTLRLDDLLPSWL